MDAILFQPDNLSVRHPNFIPQNRGNAVDYVYSLVDRYYAERTGTLQEISLYEGKNLTSQIYKISAAQGSFLLKLKRIEDHKKFEQELEKHRYLLDCALPLPLILPNSNEQDMTTHERTLSCLFSFIEGGYFSGHAGEIDGAAAIFAEMSLAAQKGGEPFRMRECSEFLRRLPNTLISCQNAPDVLPVFQKPETIPLLLESHAAVQKWLEKNTTDWVAAHLDFHPLNLLFADHKVRAVLDFEYFGSVPSPVGVGFAAYKFSRDAVAKRGGVYSDPGFQRDFIFPWLSHWNRSFRGSLSLRDITDLGLGATYRILFLIQKILSLWTESNEEKYLFDLQKQIRSLSEIRLLFHLKGTDV